MSYDISINKEEFNITYNVAGMFYATFKEKGIRHIYGITGKDSISMLMKIYTDMVVNHDEMIELEPSNGWGTFDNTLQCITKMTTAGLNNPDSVWEGD